MDRRKFLKNASIGTAAAGASALAAPAYAQGKRKLTMVTTWGRGLAGVHDAVEHVAKNITDLSDGQLEIDIKAAGEMVGAFEVFDAVSSGKADMYHGADYYFVGKNPAFAFYTAVPFGMTANELITWYLHNGGMELHHELGEQYNLISYLAGNTGAQAGGWFKKEINSPEDFKGLKFRMPGLGGEALGKLGASVQNIPGAEVYQALSSGAIDGTEWIGPWADEKAGFQEITKIYYTAGFHEPGAGLSLATNLDVYNELTPAQQQIIKVSALATHQWSLTQFWSENGAALKRLVDGGVQVKEFPNSVWDAFGKASKEVMDSYMSDEMFKKTYESMQASMKSTAKWLADSDGVYTRERNRVLGF